MGHVIEPPHRRRSLESELSSLGSPPQDNFSVISIANEVTCGASVHLTGSRERGLKNYLSPGVFMCPTVATDLSNDSSRLFFLLQTFKK